ncbi:efflux RND transporter periplasmic adaptor subunit [Neptuniibacter caesariensis]|uniref:GAF domain protein n=1 Tax=Neptuniibacter caesariensis TaxID=207954 RepID=A0A7U8C826_NEPCE|nr:HlyD family efflux transporter periplasmic adaptor subunit [Neptuniibacter caesariensis]EAR61564.1 GAF domain protein [Oceanospirillum sp. MED92] [Neptuniibacter caesariensis]
MKEEFQWLDAVAKMIPQSISAILYIQDKEQLDSYSEFVWPDSRAVDDELADFSSFALNKNSITSTVSPEGVACVCVPIRKTREHEIQGYICVKAHSSDPSAKPLINLLEWSSVWLAWLIDKPKATASSEDYNSDVAELSEKHKPSTVSWLRWGGAALVLICLLFIPIEYRVSLDASIRGAIEAPVVAPFDGFIETALVKPGDSVELDQPLATLDDRKLQLKLDNLQGEIQEKQKQYRRALVDGERGEAEVLKAKLQKANAQFALAQHQLDNSVLLAGMSGVIVEGDLRYSIGAAVDKGERIFLIVPETGHKVVLEIPETDYRFIKQGQRAELKLASIPDRAFEVALSAPSPTYIAKDNRLVYLVDAQLKEADLLALQPGMQGIAKVDVGTATLGWSIFHHFIDWLRLTFWNYKP